MFTINQRVVCIQNCVVIGEHVAQGLHGTVIVISSSFDTPTAIVRFDNGKTLPMYSSEIEAAAESCSSPM